MNAPTAGDLREQLEEDGAAVLWLSREDVNEPGAAGVLVSAPDDVQALALVVSGDNGLATLLELDRDQAEALHDALDEWLVETAPEPDVPGRPL